VVKRLVFIRAAETDWNRIGRWQGWVASPINAHGRRQAEKLARFVRHLGLSALYSSDLVRATQTAQILAGALAYEPGFDPRLRERGVGIWQGLTMDEMRTWYPAQFQALLDDPEHYRIEGAESRADVRQRMRAAFDDILREDRGETVGVLSHTSAIKLLLDQIVPDADVLDLDFGNTSVTTLLKKSTDWEIVVAQDVSHLEGMESQAVPEVEEGA
jgi:probable phosphoglycerate mutase